MLTNQKGKFRLPETVTYLNGAFMAPLLRSVEKIGHEAVSQKCLPFEIVADDFFVGTENLRKVFAGFIEAPDFLIQLLSLPCHMELQPWPIILN